VGEVLFKNKLKKWGILRLDVYKAIQSSFIVVLVVHGPKKGSSKIYINVILYVFETENSLKMRQNIKKCIKVGFPS
jgi:hypothetical protein